MPRNEFEEMLDSLIRHAQERTVNSVSSSGNKQVKLSRARTNQRRVLRRSPKRPLPRLAFITILALLILGVFVWVSHSDPGGSSTPSGARPVKATIIDQLSATYPDPYFVETATRELSSAGYAVDYYPPSDVSIELLRDLPLKGYHIVMIRAHSALGGGAAIATSQPYGEYSYLYEQLTDQIVPLRVNNDTAYFAVTPQFILDHMRGSFQGSIIIVMGCAGLVNPALADAFLERGAAAFVGWTSWVTEVRTDTSTLALVEALVQGRTVQEAVKLANDSTDPGGVNGSTLAYYDSTIRVRQQFTGIAYDLGAGLAVLSLVIFGPAILMLMPKLFGRL
jgi:hypothetical protein